MQIVQFPFIASCLLLILCLLSACQHSEDTVLTRSERKVLLLRDPHHPQARFGPLLDSLLRQYEQDSTLQIVTSYDYDQLDEANIHYYSAVLLTDLREDSLRSWHRTSLQRYLQAGNGILVADSDSLIPLEWYWYRQLREAAIRSGSVSETPDLLDFDGGRVIYLHQADVSSISTQAVDNWLRQLIGDNRYDPARIQTPLAPKSNRFTRQVLDDQLFEPMEMEILPDGNILFLERRGLMKIHDPYRKQTRVVSEFAVCTEGNYEDGLHGIALDPAYGKENYWLYLYYSPTPCTAPYQYLSRFAFRNGQIDRESEKVVMKVEVQRENCCHSGGELEFGPDGLLYLSTGDNTSPKESDGFSPIDERPGRSNFDAQATSANTHDLRGKILRIKVEADGTYSIPEGNLFPKDGSQGRPEIYVMGCRNPFRITLDPHHNILYWGDVGPDVGTAGRYGPASYDEFNQARGPGFYGWPMFIADNKPYPRRDFATDELGAYFDPAQPLNASPNNTGNRNLPPAQPAMIYYSYPASAKFPQLGKGSRSAEAGPFYYRDQMHPLCENAFPAYYEGKWFIYDWARSWIKLVTFDSSLQAVQIEDFLPDLPISKPIDIEFGPDGALYVLEYGNDYFMNNPDARLIRIDYAAGNRPPVARLQADQMVGAPPFPVVFSAESSFDYDPGDRLTYQWDLGNEMVSGSSPHLRHVFTQPGTYPVKLTVSDPFGKESSSTLDIKVGNEPPRIQLASGANQSFYFASDQSFPYRFIISDREDEQTGGLDLDRAWVHSSYVADRNYLEQVRQQKIQLPDGPLSQIMGKRLMDLSDCASCHHEQQENIGPSFRAIAAKYQATDTQIEQLGNKIIKGGNGVWGDKAMAAHPQISPEDAQSMVRYILSLNDYSRLPLQGTIALQDHHTAEGGGYVLVARYQDRGYRQADELRGEHIAILRSPQLEAENADYLEGAYIPGSGVWMGFNRVHFRANGYLRFDAIDLRDISQIRLHLLSFGPAQIELRLDSPTGNVLAQQTIRQAENWQDIILAIPSTASVHDVYLFWRATASVQKDDMGEHRPADVGYLDWLRFEK